VPVIQSVTVSGSGDTLTVVVTGLSNTRDLASAAFTFTAASGATIQGGDGSLTANLASSATTYFQSVSGGAFIYTQTFNLTTSAADVASVTVSLTNSVGSVTAPAASQ
jgi:hypothetical protein